MCRLIETIKVKDGQACHLAYHNQRMNNSRWDLWHCRHKIDITTRIKRKPKAGLWKCRILYKKEIEEIQFYPYSFPLINTLKCIKTNAVEYNHKYENREALKRLFRKRGQADDILIIQNGRVTDTFFCNLVFEQSGNLYTPSLPLLKGTRRDRLLKGGSIEEKNIRLEDLWRFDKAYLINAMIGIEDDISVDIENILL